MIYSLNDELNIKKELITNLKKDYKNMSGDKNNIEFLSDLSKFDILLNIKNGKYDKNTIKLLTIIKKLFIEHKRLKAIETKIKKLNSKTIIFKVIDVSFNFRYLKLKKFREIDLKS